MVPAQLPFHIGQLVTRNEKQGVYRVLGYQEKNGHIAVLLANVTDMFHADPIYVRVFGELQDASHLDV